MPSTRYLTSKLSSLVCPRVANDSYSSKTSKPNRPCRLSNYRENANLLSIVLLLPPAPAARVLLGRTLATLSARSAAAFLLIAVAGPPGAFAEEVRAVVAPVEGEPGVLAGDEGRGDDCEGGKS